MEVSITRRCTARGSSRCISHQFFLFFFRTLISESAKTSKKATDREQTEAPFPPIAIFTPCAPPPTCRSIHDQYLTKLLILATSRHNARRAQCRDVARIIIRQRRVYVFSAKKHSQTYFHAIRFEIRDHRQPKPLPPRPPPRQAMVAASHHCSDGDNRGTFAACLCPPICRRGGGRGADDDNYSTPSSTLTRSSSAAVAVAGEDNPTQRPRWQRRYH